jgi:hypothetical protein
MFGRLAERGLVHGHRSARLGGGEEEVVPRLGHAFDRRGVVRVGVADGADVREMEKYRQQDDARQQQVRGRDPPGKFAVEEGSGVF